MRIENDLKLDFDDVLIRPKRSSIHSRKEPELRRTFTFRNCYQSISVVPIIASNMDTVGTFEAAKVMQHQYMLTFLHKFYKHEELHAINNVDRNYAWPTYGEGDIPPELPPHFYGIRLDVANGYRESFVEFVKKVRGKHPHRIIAAGNVCTPEITEELLLAGADIICIGIGCGGQCTTRLKTGIGYPQLSAIIECADAAHGLGGHIASDGGCRYPADVCKAFAAGADFVVLGSMLAGHDENTRDENIVYEEEEAQVSIGNELIGSIPMPKYAKVYGMSSKTAMNKYHGGIADYRSAEGKETLIPYRGELRNTLEDILGGLRSCCTYVGATHLKHLTKRATFIRTNATHNTHWRNDE